MKRLASNFPRLIRRRQDRAVATDGCVVARALAIAMSIAVFHGVGVEDFSAVMEPFREASV